MTKKKLPVIVCPKKCAQGFASKRHTVRPCDIRMTDADVTEAKLHKNGCLFLCGHCGCVWEEYRDEASDLLKRRIGSYDGAGPVCGFVPFRDQLL